MSWNFRKSGTSKETLKAAVNAEIHCPPAVRERICEQIDTIVLNMLSSGEPSQIILVESSGHLQELHAQPTYGASTETTNVHVVEFHGAVPKAPAEDAPPVSGT